MMSDLCLFYYHVSGSAGDTCAFQFAMAGRGNKEMLVDVIPVVRKTVRTF